MDFLETVRRTRVVNKKRGIKTAGCLFCRKKPNHVTSSYIRIAQFSHSQRQNRKKRINGTLHGSFKNHLEQSGATQAAIIGTKNVNKNEKHA